MVQLRGDNKIENTKYHCLFDLTHKSDIIDVEVITKIIKSEQKHSPIKPISYYLMFQKLRTGRLILQSFTVLAAVCQCLYPLPGILINNNIIIVNYYLYICDLYTYGYNLFPT